MGSLVGQTEANVRQALRIVDAMAPAILFLDEVEKALSGGLAGGAGDSGVAARLLGTLLTWLNDHASNIFVVATANDISRLPPEFSRAERFDAIFFLDFPDSPQRAKIWQIYCRGYALDPAQKRPADEGWTGAEIRACCRLAALLDVPLVAAAQNIVPVGRTSAEAIGRLREWAAGRCLAADQAGLYRPAGRCARRKLARANSPAELN
jgi:SpoVK/Ycf46/Vps4 family AAA+-type ATPase